MMMAPTSRANGPASGLFRRVRDRAMNLSEVEGWLGVVAAWFIWCPGTYLVQVWRTTGLAVPSNA